MIRAMDRPPHVPGHRAKIPAANVRGRGQPGARQDHARKRHRAEPHRARLHLLRPARHRQDHRGAHSGALPELRGRAHGHALRRVRELHGNHRRRHGGRDRNRRGFQSRHQRDARVARERALPAGARPLQDLHHRRSAPDHQRSFQRAAQDHRGAAAVGGLRAVHHRGAQDSGHHRLALPALQLPVGGFRRSGGAHGVDLRSRKASKPMPKRWPCWRRRARAACAIRFRRWTRLSPAAARSSMPAKCERCWARFRWNRSKPWPRRCLDGDSRRMLEVVDELEAQRPQLAALQPGAGALLPQPAGGAHRGRQRAPDRRVSSAAAALRGDRR